MIVYPAWETTPSPVVEASKDQSIKKKKKKKIEKKISEQLPLFIDDYAISQVKNAEQILDFSSFLDKLISKPPKFNAYNAIAKYKSVEAFDNSIYLQAFNSADNIWHESEGTAKITLEVTKDQIPPVIMQLPSGMALSDQEVAEAFGLPAKDLVSITIEVVKDAPMDLYKVQIERRVYPTSDDIF